MEAYDPNSKVFSDQLISFNKVVIWHLIGRQVIISYAIDT